MSTYRFEVDMTIWGYDARFVFANLSDGGYKGAVVFPKKLLIGNIIEKAWKELLPNEKYPFVGLKLEIDRIMAMMKETKDGNTSVIMVEVLIEGVMLGIYFIRDKNQDKAVSVFSIQPQKTVRMDSLPGVNARLPDPLEAGLSVVLSTGDASFNIGGKSFDFKKGFSFDCKITIPHLLDEKLVYHHRTQQDKNATDGAADHTLPKVTDTTPSPMAAGEAEAEKGKIKWFKLNKKIGNIATIHRLGLQYENQKVSVLFDLDANFSILKMGLIGLQMSLDLRYVSYFKDFGSSNAKLEQVREFVKDAVHIGLDGIGIGLETKALTISGMLVKQQLQINNRDYEQYIGGLVIKTKAFNMTCLGAYGEIDGYQSFFLYGFLGVPIGGVPFFFVEGLALGFGYNRQVIVPEINQVSEFPLVRMVMGSSDPNESETAQMTKMIPMISAAFPPKEDNFFFAIGIKFNSFKLIDGFLLLMVSIGDQLRIDLLGLCVLAMPKNEPMIVVELAMKATIIPEDGTIKIDAIITENSYIFSKNARLQGGFAFYSWTKDTEENGKQIHAGDFVLTIGGYHPRYQKPDHYPTVPRFGLNWRVTDHLTIKAAAYFALTPSAVMAGGELRAVYETKKLNASFKLWADFLIQWKPFYYDISVGIEIRVAYKTWLKTWRFSLGVSAYIWGPQFSGKVPLSGKSFLLTGDAASLINPLTGEGIGSAMLSAEVAAKHLIEAFEKDDFSAEFMLQYDQKIHQKFWKTMQVSYWTQRLLQDREKLINLSIKLSAKNGLVKKWLNRMF